MIAIAGLLVVIMLALLVGRVATIALTVTGLSREVARFQARSALTGVGYTTGEAESIVNHPVRRRVVMTLMLVGSAGVITVITTLLISLVGEGRQATGTRIAVLLAGLAVIVWGSRIPVVDRSLSRWIERGLRRWTTLDTRDYASLLRVSGAYSIVELAVEEGDWVAGRTLEELALRDEGIAVLAVVRPDGTYLGVPNGATAVCPGDTLVLYGRDGDLDDLDRRAPGAAGEEAHRRAVARQNRIEREEAAEDPARDAAPPAAARR